MKRVLIGILLVGLSFPAQAQFPKLQGATTRIMTVAQFEDDVRLYRETAIRTEISKYPKKSLQVTRDADLDQYFRENLYQFYRSKGIRIIGEVAGVEEQ